MKNLQLLIGATGVTVTMFRFHGYVLIGNERFVARSYVLIEEGTKVFVHKVELNQLIIAPLN
ncbi:hypothetical protein C7N43_02760 [Sphingobacteriales bacterium UPWRP_1]|nr:hypothetical protein BVG80_09270 [Sphingobacteriales bacterium TSM_CSM]PSJ78542.1 hypothetical protein C7N43_02760 [Sphingobacteriales bacterium UPWRP_1]